MISIVSFLLPFNGHFFSHFGIFFSLRFIQHFSQATITCNSHNSLSRQICIMCQMTRKIFGTQLILRIQSLFCQIVTPNGQCFPMFCCIVCVPIGNGNCGCHYQHIPCLFHRHILLISLSVC